MVDATDNTVKEKDQNPQVKGRGMHDVVGFCPKTHNI